MDKILKNKKILSGIIILIFGFIAYSVFLKPDVSTTADLVTGTSVSNQQLVTGKEILALLVDLKSIQLQSDIFRDKAFRSLDDFSIPISPEPQGRTNPFAPVGADSIVEEEEG